jgi:hypothetical protein
MAPIRTSESGHRNSSVYRPGCGNILTQDIYLDVAAMQMPKNRARGSDVLPNMAKGKR